MVGQVGGVSGEVSREVVDDLTEDDVGRGEVEAVGGVEVLIGLEWVGLGREVAEGVSEVREGLQLHGREQERITVDLLDCLLGRQGGSGNRF